MKWSNLLLRAATLRLFNESGDAGDGNPSATIMMLASALIGHVCVAVALIGLLLGSSNTFFTAMSALFVCYTITCGIAWHAGLKGRAKNGLVLMLAVSILLFFLR